jgi:hypothetical protein
MARPLLAICCVLLPTGQCVFPDRILLETRLSDNASIENQLSQKRDSWSIPVISFTDLMNRCVQGIKFLSANITQDQGIIVGRETCPDRVAKPRLPNAGQARYDFHLSVGYVNSLDPPARYLS